MPKVRGIRFHAQSPAQTSFWSSKLLAFGSRPWRRLTALLVFPTRCNPIPKALTTIPEEKIVLRYTNAIQEKYRKYLRYLRDGRVGKNDAFVIAINAANLLHRWTQAEDDAPRFLKAVYPLGRYQLILDRLSGNIVGHQNETRFEITKASGKKVEVLAFLDRRWRGISGILCSFAHACYSGPLGLDFELAYNPLGRAPLPPDLITAKRIWTADLNEAGGNLVGRTLIP
jgi:hypothetical protein